MLLNYRQCFHYRSLLDFINSFACNRRSKNPSVPTGSLWLIYHEVAVINGEVSLGIEKLEAWAKAAIRKQRRTCRSTQGPRSPINQTQIKGLSARVMFKQKDIVRRPINSILFIQPSREVEGRPSFLGQDHICFCSYIQRWHGFTKWRIIHKKPNSVYKYVHFVGMPLGAYGVFLKQRMILYFVNGTSYV